MATPDRRYRAEQSGDVVCLEDRLSNLTVSVCVSCGNNAFELRVNGVDVLWRPYDSLDDFKTRGHGRGGIPFLAPWANRLDEPAFYANGRRFSFDLDIGNVHGPVPIHGLVMRTDQWQVVDVSANDEQSWVTSRLEFFRAPLWMKQFPFAHVIEMTHRLANGGLDITTRIENLSADPMPVAVGFHPYFRLTDCPRDEWTVSIGERTHWLLSDGKLPTGEFEPIESVFSDPLAVNLKDQDLDDVFSGPVRDQKGHAKLCVRGAKQRIDVQLGPKYDAAVVYAPKSSPAATGNAPFRGDFVCLEPMAAITNAMNLAHRGVYGNLQYIPPGERWEETFWITPDGF